MMAKRASDAIITTAMSKMKLFGTGIGLMTAVVPRIKNTLKMLLPTMLPIAISFFLSQDALIEVANSGSEVPTATIVRPIKPSFTPKLLAITTAESTIHLPPKNRAVSPSKTRKIDSPGRRY